MHKSVWGVLSEILTSFVNFQIDLFELQKLPLLIFIEYFCKKTLPTCFLKYSWTSVLIWKMKNVEICFCVSAYPQYWHYYFSYVYEFIYERFWLSSKFTDVLTSQGGWKTSGNTMENQDQQEEYLRPANNLLFLTTKNVKCL